MRASRRRRLRTLIISEWIALSHEIGILAARGKTCISTVDLKTVTHHYPSRMNDVDSNQFSVSVISSDYCECPRQNVVFSQYFRHREIGAYHVRGLPATPRAKRRLRRRAGIAARSAAGPSRANRVESALRRSRAACNAYRGRIAGGTPRPDSACAGPGCRLAQRSSRLCLQSRIPTHPVRPRTLPRFIARSRRAI